MNIPARAEPELQGAVRDPRTELLKAKQVLNNRGVGGEDTDRKGVRDRHGKDGDRTMKLRMAFLFEGEDTGDSVVLVAAPGYHKLGMRREVIGLEIGRPYGELEGELGERKEGYIEGGAKEGGGKPDRS